MEVGLMEIKGALTLSGEPRADYSTLGIVSMNLQPMPLQSQSKLQMLQLARK